MFFPTLLQDYLKISAEKLPHKEALICGNDRYTYSEIDRKSDVLALCLQTMGVQRGNRVVVFLDNCAETVISIYGILKSNAVFVILNGGLKSKKLAFVLNDCAPTVLITHSSKAKVCQEAFEEINLNCGIIWCGKSTNIPQGLASISSDWDGIFSTVFNSGLTTSSINSNNRNNIDLDLAALIYTSGSTGEPKGVMSTHKNMLSAARSIIQYLDNSEDDIILNVLPLSFDYGLYQLLMSFIFGGTVVLEKSFLFLHNVLEKITSEKVTGFPIVPTILAMLLNLQNLDSYDFGSLRYISNTGAALPVEHIRKLRKLFPEVSIYSMFGLTECKRVSYLPPEEIDRRPDSVGKPMPNCEVFIVDDKGKEVKPGETGELVVRGSNVMQGYWNSKELTKKYFRADPNSGEILLHSGDYFRTDADGYLYFIGRKDDMIKSKGERISAKELENTISEMPGVSEVSVVGVPDEIFGQAIKAVIVKNSSLNLAEKDVLRFCTQNLEPFAVPKYIEFLETLPKTAHGKINKKVLK